jgi:hypothetical protein
LLSGISAGRTPADGKKCLDDYVAGVHPPMRRVAMDFAR